MTAAPLVPSDLYRLALPSDPQRSPDGRTFFTVTTNDEPADAMRTAIYATAAGVEPRQFTAGQSDRMPRLSPDGSRLAFVGERGDGKRIYVVPTNGGEARALGEAYDAIVALVWAPDGATLAFVATAPHEPQDAKIALDERSGARHIRALPYKSDDEGLLDGRRKHLFTLGVDGGETTRLTEGDFDVGGPAWSPDGTRLAFAARIDAPEDGFSDDLYVVERATRRRTKLTASRGPANAPAFSHDGREIAYIGHERGDDAGGRFNNELLVIASTGGTSRSLSAPLDRSVTDWVICDTRNFGTVAPSWSDDDAEIVVSLSDAGTCGVAAFARDGSGHRLLLTGERDISGFSRGADGGLSFVVSTPTVPGDVGELGADGVEGRLSTFNPWLADRTLREPRRVRPPASDGTLLDLWLLDPASAQNGTPVPYILQVHGGPHTAYGYAFMFEFQMLAGHGIGVAYGNPRGSQSYGEAYADAITGDWGGVDAADVLALLDAAQANAPIDVARVGLAGGSYGGFMTTWLLGHSDRFAAGVSMRAVNDFVSEVGATDLGWFLERETEAPWSDGGAKLFALSPMRAAHRIDVPLLIEHSDRDYRCAIDQAEQLFTLLRRLGRKQTEFVRFTGDGHNLSRGGKPRNRVLRLRSIAHWFVRHLRPDGVTAAAQSAGALFAPLPSENGAP